MDKQKKPFSVKSGVLDERMGGQIYRKAPIERKTVDETTENNLLLNSGDNPYSGSVKTIRKVFPSYAPKLQTADDRQKYSKADVMAIGRDVTAREPAMVNALRIAKNAVIGGGWTLSLKPDYEALGVSFEEAEAWANRIEALFNNYAQSPDCHFDAARQMTFMQILSAAYISMVVDGDAYGVMKWKQSSNGLFTCVSLIDAARVSTPKAFMNDASVKNGVRINADGEPIEYYVNNPFYKKSVQTGNFFSDRDFFTVKKKTDFGRPIMIHAFNPTMPEQTTGIGEYFSGVYFLKLVSEYLSNENQRAALQASFGVAFKSTEDYATVMSEVLGKGVNSAEDAVKTYNELIHAGHEMNFDRIQEQVSGLASDRGVKVTHLLPNEEIQLLTKGDNINSFEGFMRASNKVIASSVGVDYSSMYNDYADISYSAARFSASQVQLNYDAQKEILSRKFAMPLVHCFVEELLDKEILKLPKGVNNFYEAKDFLLKGGFISSGKPIIDPLKEAKAQTEKIMNGLITKEEVCALEGRNYKEIANQIKRERELEKRLGIFKENTKEPSLGSSVGNGLDAPDQ
jgi:lambda family phage portal protein